MAATAGCSSRVTNRAKDISTATSSAPACVAEPGENVGRAGLLRLRGRAMSDQAANFIGSIPENYDRGLGPVFFTDFADDLARRVAASAPQRVLETSAGTGIVTRRLRDMLPANAQLIATDL